MRFGTFTAILLIAAAATEACSLLLPYDEYPGTAPVPHADDAGKGDSGTVDDGAVVVVDGSDVPDACVGIDRQTDPNNCGACGRRCPTGACAAGKCPIDTLTPNGGSRVVSLDFETSPDAGDALYFTRASGVLGRVVMDGGQLESATTNKANGHVYLAPNGRSGIFGGTDSIWLFRTTAFATDTPDHIVDRPALGPVLYAGALAYFGDDKGIGWAEAKADGAVTAVAGPAPVALTARTGRVYWAATNGDVFTMRAANPQTPALVVSTARTGLSSIAATPTFLYLGHPSQGLVIYNLNATTLTASQSRIVSLDDVEAIASDNVHVYVLDFPGNRTTGRLLRTNLDGQELVVLATGLTPSYALEVSGDYVYFASGGQIQRTAK